VNVHPARAACVTRLPGAYSLCGVGIEVRATGEAAALISSRLRFLRSPAAGPAEVVFDIRAGRDDGFAASPEGAGRPVYDASPGQLMYFEESDQLFIDYPGRFRMLCRPAAGLVQSAVLSDVPGHVLAAFLFFTIPLMEVMKRRGRFPLHAGCVARDGRGVLLAGTSGAGKSTLTAALVADGWDFLSDDTVFVARSAEAIMAWGFSDEIDCSDDTAGMLAELRHLVGKPTLAGRPKHPVNVEEAFGVRPVPACRPHALVLPTISGQRASVVTAVSPAHALRELAPNILLTERAATQAHFDMLAALVREIPCYSMATGTDLSSARGCLQEILR